MYDDRGSLITNVRLWLDVKATTNILYLYCWWEGLRVLVGGRVIINVCAMVSGIIITNVRVWLISRVSLLSFGWIYCYIILSW